MHSDRQLGAEYHSSVPGVTRDSNYCKHCDKTPNIALLPHSPAVLSESTGVVLCLKLMLQLLSVLELSLLAPYLACY